MSKLGKRLIQAAREGTAIARGELDPATYRVHHDDDADAGRSRVSFMHQSGPGMFGGRKARAWKRGARVARSARKTKKK
jgi:hypothetical protein